MPAASLSSSLSQIFRSRKQSTSCNISWEKEEEGEGRHRKMNLEWESPALKKPRSRENNFHVLVFLRMEYVWAHLAYLPYSIFFLAGHGVEHCETWITNSQGESKSIYLQGDMFYLWGRKRASRRTAHPRTNLQESMYPQLIILWPDYNYPGSSSMFTCPDDQQPTWY